MMFSNEKYAKYICLIVIILLNLALPSAVAIKCIQCAGSQNKCSPTVGETAKECPDETYTKCFTQIDTSGNIERGCKTDEEAKDCIADKNCVATNALNNQLICKNCNATDEKCSQTDMNFNDYQYNQICDVGVKNCIKKVVDKLVVRGCDSVSDITKCTDEKTCETCDSVNCNTGIFPTKRINCYQCSGSSCVDVTAISSKPCANYVNEDQCYTLGKSETDMIRGCKSDTKENQCSSDNAAGCAYCTADNCNNLKYKYDQVLKCHQCTSDDTTNDCFKEQTSTDLKNCEKQILYNEPEYCYTQISGSKIQRGCLHDNTDLSVDKCKDGDSETCNKCNKENGCNSKAVTIQFTCIVCRSDLDEKCWNHADTLQGQKCRTNDSSAKEGCFHGLWNGVAIRGCMVDATKPNQEICKDEKNLQCKACYEKNCNTEKSAASKIGVQFALLLIVLSVLWNLK